MLAVKCLLVSMLMSSIYMVVSPTNCTDGSTWNDFLQTSIAKIGTLFTLLFDIAGGQLFALSPCSHLRNFGGGVVPGKTIGEVWPLPQQVQQQKTYLKLTTPNFQFAYQGSSCGIVDRAIQRYKDLIFNPPRFASYVGINDAMSPADSAGQLPQIQLIVTGACESLPYFKMDESYELKVGTADLPAGSAELKANSVWGLLRGLETFSQLVYHANEQDFYINVTHITDFPRFPFRGFMLETSRHYVSLDNIRKHLDAMAYNKFNVFHWHITDDPSFPYQSQTFPELSAKGAFNPDTLIYTMLEIKDVVAYAADRGIRVIPEFDTPGHTQSWGLSVQNLRTQCSSDNATTGISRGSLNPAIEATYQFMDRLFNEVGTVFPDKTFHLGGDEVDENCWKSNAQVRQFMLTHPHLLTYYMNRLIDTVGSLSTGSRNAIVWHEVFDDQGPLNKSAIINVWQPLIYSFKMAQVTAKGYQVILSACWYLDNPPYGRDWVEFYSCEPLDFIGLPSQYDLVLGGTGCMWAANTDGTNLMASTWPRASAVAERLWSARSVTNINAASPRLDEQRCRMVERGINAAPVNGPSYCPSDYLVN